MSIDRREDAGDFYPGGKVISTRPVTTGGDVKHSDFAGLDVKTNTIPDLREAVRELGRRLGATVVTALAACVAVAATVQTVPVNDLDFDANPSIVTNVVFDAPPDFSTNNTALVATIEATAPAPGDYAAVSNAAINALSRAEAGLSAWSLAPSPQAPWSIQYERANGIHAGGWLLVIDSQRIGFYEGEETATTIVFTDYTATRTRLPTKADIPTAQINAATATNALQDTALESHASQLSQLSQSLDGKVPTSRTINGKALTSNISLSADEVGATTPEDVTAAIREQSLGGIWDEELQVWWTPVMRNGSLTYQATTNVNLNAEN